MRYEKWKDISRLSGPLGLQGTLLRRSNVIRQFLFFRAGRFRLNLRHNNPAQSVRLRRCVLAASGALSRLATRECA